MKDKERLDFMIDREARIVALDALPDGFEYICAWYTEDGDIINDHIFNDPRDAIDNAIKQYKAL